MKRSTTRSDGRVAHALTRWAGVDRYASDWEEYPDARAMTMGRSSTRVDSADEGVGRFGSFFASGSALHEDGS